MPTTINEGFIELRRNLHITDLQSSTVSTRQQTVREAVEDDFSVLNSFLIGSYARSTMIAPLSEADIDIFLVLHPQYFSEYSPAQLLDALRRTLLKRYPRTPKISRNGQAVTITFTDFCVDVVPGFLRNGGGYLIPNSVEGRWISTDPTVHSTLMTATNSQHKGNFIPLVKMIKGWNRIINDAFVGFYLELLTRQVLSGATISSFPSGVRFVFDKGREAVKYKIVDPAGFGEQINGLNYVRTVNDAVSRFQTAFSRATKAERLANNGYIALAFDEWGKIFGRYFPAYG